MVVLLRGASAALSGTAGWSRGWSVPSQGLTHSYEVDPPTLCGSAIAQLRRPQPTTLMYNLCIIPIIKYRRGL